MTKAKRPVKAQRFKKPCPKCHKPTSTLSVSPHICGRLCSSNRFVPNPVEVCYLLEDHNGPHRWRNKNPKALRHASQHILECYEEILQPIRSALGSERSADGLLGFVVSWLLEERDKLRQQLSKARCGLQIR